MPAIKSTGAYIPYYRLECKEIARAWGGGPARGEKALRNFDEDSITISVEACRDCLKGIDRNIIDGLYFASTTAPYKEKQSASTIAAALDLDKNIFTIDITDSIRAGTNAIKAALDAVKSGSLKNVIVVASDCRTGLPGSSFENILGDGAAALLISDQGSVDFNAFFSHTNEIIDQWRTNSQPYIKTWEDRFVKSLGYTANVKKSLGRFLTEQNLTIEDFDKVALYAPDARSLKGICKSFDIDPATRLQDPMFDSVGNTGASFALLMLIGAIENANENDNILMVNYGDGCDVLSFFVKEKPKLHNERKGVKGHIESKGYINNYEKYLQFRQLMEIETGRNRPPKVSSAVAIQRDSKMIYSLSASECTSCGRQFFPPQRICLYCKAKDQFKKISISERKGKLFTYSKDELAETIDPPLIVSIIDVEGNVRFFGQMTDRDPENIKIDMPLEFTFRKLGEAGGFNTYFWKCRPIR